MKKKLCILTLFLFNIGFSQSIPFSYLNTDSSTLIRYLSNNDNFWYEKKMNILSFQSKNGSTFIKVYKSAITNVTIDFDNKSDYIKTLIDIKKKAYFQYKFCSDYNSSIVYTYKTNFNTIRFNLIEFQISIQYNSELDSLFEENQHTFPVFICPTYDSYAYHTNLKCNGLNNCNDNINRYNLRDIKKSSKYKLCEICSSD